MIRLSLLSWSWIQQKGALTLLTVSQELKISVKYSQNDIDEIKVEQTMYYAEVKDPVNVVLVMYSKLVDWFKWHFQEVGLSGELNLVEQYSHWRHHAWQSWPHWLLVMAVLQSCCSSPPHRQCGCPNLLTWTVKCKVKRCTTHMHCSHSQFDQPVKRSESYSSQISNWIWALQSRVCTNAKFSCGIGKPKLVVGKHLYFKDKQLIMAEPRARKNSSVYKWRRSTAQDEERVN